MAKPNKRFVCSNCGSVSSRWAGQCDSCGEWNTIHEDAAAPASTFEAKRSQTAGGRRIDMKPLSAAVELPPRSKTGMGELDNVLGGGLVRGSVGLISGEPGIGKSTLLIQAAAAVARTGADVAYVSGEEDDGQVRLRAQRLGLGDAGVQLGHSTSVRDILTTVGDAPPKLLVIDSIQTMRSDAIDSSPGTVTQVKACANALIEFAKATGTAIMIVGHVNKNGDLAGPRTLEHMVDLVLSFEGDRSHQYRILRAVKNRYGATDEVGVFEMREQGLVEVSNPSSLFLVERGEQVPGACVMPTVEGGRSILVEIQALVVKRGDQGYPKRSCVGWDKNRLDTILAVLEARYGIPMSTADVYLNVAGNYRLADPAADVAVAAAIVSAYADKPLPTGLVAFGELSLSGDVRPVAHHGLRLRESSRLGFDKAWSPKATDASSPPASMQVRTLPSLHHIVTSILGNPE